MNFHLKTLASLACAVPLAVLAQTQPSTATDKATGTPPAGMESKKSTDTGQTTTYPKSDGGSEMKKSGANTATDKNKVTKGADKMSSDSSMAPMDPSTTQKPAKEGSQSGPTK